MGRNPLNIFPWLAERGLDAWEVQMTFGPRQSEQSCRDMRAAAEDHGISLSVHASYYIVLTTPEADKLQRSWDRLARTFELADILGTDIVVVHPGALYKDDPGTIMARFQENLVGFHDRHGPRPIALETAGKRGQFGSLDEILAICESFPVCLPCVDFGHVHAYEGGTLEKPGAIEGLVQRMAEWTAAGEGRRCHWHYTAIEWGPKGEITHRKITDHDKGGHLFHPRPEAVGRALRKHFTGGPWRLISETKNSQEEGALAVKKAYRKKAKS